MTLATMSEFLASMTWSAYSGHGGHAEIPLWSQTPVTVHCEVQSDAEVLTPATEALLAHIEASLPALWPAIEPALLDAANAKEAWKLLSRLDSLTVMVKEGSAQWSLAATFSGKRDGFVYFVEIENDIVVGSWGGD